jgi:oligopeptidase A
MAAGLLEQCCCVQIPPAGAKGLELLYCFNKKIMHRLLLKQSSRRVANYGLLRRSIASVSATAAPKLMPLRRLTPIYGTTMINKRLTFMNQQRSMASVTPAYKETPFLKWKLFPDFEHLVTQTSPAIAVPAFEKLIDAAKHQFVQIEKTFEPTWDGTIGQCKPPFFLSRNI